MFKNDTDRVFRGFAYLTIQAALNTTIPLIFALYPLQAIIPWIMSKPSLSMNFMQILCLAIIITASVRNMVPDRNESSKVFVPIVSLAISWGIVYLLWEKAFEGTWIINQVSPVQALLICIPGRIGLLMKSLIRFIVQRLEHPTPSRAQYGQYRHR